MKDDKSELRNEKVAEACGLQRDVMKLRSDGLSMIESALQKHYFSGSSGVASSKVTQKELNDHLTGRFVRTKEVVIPWLSSFLSMRGLKMLEVGCGTGSSTLALIETGVDLSAIDVHADSIEVAKVRCGAYGVSANFIVGNVVDIENIFSLVKFDVIIFFASLEHMTFDERRGGLSAGWRMLRPGGHLVVVETPNRLWYFDHHTSHLPFFNWLPDDLALEYSRFSAREGFSDRYRAFSPQELLHFLRRGRGVSFHEFQLFIDPVLGLSVDSCLQSFQSKRRSQRGVTTSLDHEFTALLRKLCPEVPIEFLHPSLDLAIKKPPV